MEDLAKCQEDLKEAGEMVKHSEGSILDVEKEMGHAWSKRDKARSELAKAHNALCEHERALVVTIRERNSLKVHVARIRALVAQAHEEPI